MGRQDPNSIHLNTSGTDTTTLQPTQMYQGQARLRQIPSKYIRDRQKQEVQVLTNAGLLQIPSTYYILYPISYSSRTPPPIQRFFLCHFRKNQLSFQQKGLYQEYLTPRIYLNRALCQELHPIFILKDPRSFPLASFFIHQNYRMHLEIIH